MNTLLMFLSRAVMAPLGFFRRLRQEALGFPEVVLGIESLTGSTFRHQDDDLRAVPELTFTDYAGESVSVLIERNGTFSILRGEAWETGLAPDTALQSVWSDLRGR